MTAFVPYEAHDGPVVDAQGRAPSKGEWVRYDLSKPLYIADGLVVRKQTMQRSTATGRRITLGFVVCRATEDVGAEGAAMIAAALCAYEAEPEGVREKIAKAVFPLLDGNGRSLEAANASWRELAGHHPGMLMHPMGTKAYRIADTVLAIHPPVMAALEAVHGEAERLGAHTMQNSQPEGGR